MSISKKILNVVESINRSMSEGILDKRISNVLNDSAKKELMDYFEKAKSVFNGKIPHVIWLFDSYIEEEAWEYLISMKDLPSLVTASITILKQRIDRFEHYYSYGISAIDRYPLKGDPEKVLIYFNNKVKEWEEKNGRMIPVGKTKDTTVLLECSDPKFVWFDLNTNDCRIEASAGNHCARDTEADTLWSLREKVFNENGEIKGYITRITASYRKRDNALIQIKGNKNSKPINYKDYFIELAKSGMFERIDLETAYKNYIDLYWNDFSANEIKEMWERNKNLEKDSFFNALYFKTKRNSKVTGTNGIEYSFNSDGVIETMDIYVDWEDSFKTVKCPKEVTYFLKKISEDYPTYVRFRIKDNVCIQFDFLDDFEEGESYTCLPIKKDEIYNKNLNVVLHSYDGNPAIHNSFLKYWCDNGNPIKGENPYLSYRYVGYNGETVEYGYYYCEDEEGLLCEIDRSMGKKGIFRVYSTENPRVFLVKTFSGNDSDYSFSTVYKDWGDYWTILEDDNWELYQIGDNPVSGRYENGKKTYEVFERNYVQTCVAYFDSGKVSGIERYDVEGRDSGNDDLYLNNGFKPSYEYFFENGKKKREEWYKDNQLHRDDGPAVSQWDASGTIVKEEYWLDGTEVSEEEVVG